MADETEETTEDVTAAAATEAPADDAEARRDADDRAA